MPASEPAGKAPPSVDLTHALGRIQVPAKAMQREEETTPGHLAGLYSRLNGCGLGFLIRRVRSATGRLACPSHSLGHRPSSWLTFRVTH